MGITYSLVGFYVYSLLREGFSFFFLYVVMVITSLYWDQESQFVTKTLLFADNPFCSSTFRQRTSVVLFSSWPMEGTSHYQVNGHLFASDICSYTYISQQQEKIDGFVSGILFSKQPQQQHWDEIDYPYIVLFSCTGKMGLCCVLLSSEIASLQYSTSLKIEKL